MADAGPVLEDLGTEGDELERLVAELPPKGWSLATPAKGWTVAHQIAHLAWTDEQMLLAATDQEAFQRAVERAAAAPARFVDDGAEEGARLPSAELLERWRATRVELLRTLRSHPAGQRVPWYGPSMSVASAATARLMETWAHGEDIAEALEVRREPTARLRHVVLIGVRARDFAYLAHGLQPPERPFRVEVTGPHGQCWAHGPEEAEDRVWGSALDFCRVVTQRLNRADADVHTSGEEAERWLGIAQAFAGPPGAGRPPSSAARGSG